VSAAVQLTRLRCHHHAEREAAARCPECGFSYCRECIAEHEERIICATCLRKLLAPPEEKRRPWAGAVSSVAGSLGGLVFAWLCFYCLGRMLLMVPSTFHLELWGDSVENASEVKEASP